jgi:hypothetical protein
MNNLRIIIIFSLIVTSFGFMKCSKEVIRESTPVIKINLDSISFQHSMKGWELYSWPNGKDWNYSILIGTNRIKSYEEVTTNQIIVFGKDSLKMLLARIPENEYIFWVGKEWLGKSWGSNFGTLSLPDNKTVNEIKEYCIQKKLVLSVSS